MSRGALFRVRWLAAVGVFAACAAWWFTSGDDLRVPTIAAAPIPNTATPARPDIAPPAATAALTRAAAEPAVHCAHQQIELMWAERRQRACVAATRVSQTGSVRSYVLEREGLSAWTLTVDAADGQVIAARLASSEAGDGSQRYACRVGACAGFSLGPPDAHGQRALRVDGATLKAVGEAAPAPGAVRLSAALTVGADHTDPALACADAPLAVVESDGSVLQFCAGGGAGFELADDGRRTYQFQDLEGRSLQIGLTADGAINRVSLGALACRDSACGGAAMQVGGDPASPGAERSFSFSGTTLVANAAGRRTATLNGSLTMPSQE